MQSGVMSNVGSLPQNQALSAKKSNQEYKDYTSEKLREILFKTKQLDKRANYDANGNIKAKVSTFDTTQKQLKKVVLAQKSGLG